MTVNAVLMHFRKPVVRLEQTTYDGDEQHERSNTRLTAKTSSVVDRISDRNDVEGGAHALSQACREVGANNLRRRRTARAIEYKTNGKDVFCRRSDFRSE